MCSRTAHRVHLSLVLGSRYPSPSLSAHADSGIETIFRLDRCCSFAAGAGQGGGEGERAFEGSLGALPDFEDGVEVPRPDVGGRGLFGREADLGPVGAVTETVVEAGFVGEGEGMVVRERWGRTGTGGEMEELRSLRLDCDLVRGIAGSGRSGALRGGPAAHEAT